jgi:hypothetical protein
VRIKSLVEKNLRERAHGRSGSRLEDNIKIDLRKIGFECVDWINVVQDRDRLRLLVNTITNFRVTKIPRNLFIT